MSLTVSPGVVAAAAPDRLDDDLFIQLHPAVRGDITAL